MTTQTQTYAENIAVLNEVATKLRAQTEPDIDTLVPMVDRALKAHGECKARLQAVRAALEERLPRDAQ